jgi:hypothetical protein
MQLFQLFDFLRHGLDEEVDLDDSTDIDVGLHHLAHYLHTLDSDLVGFIFIYFTILHSVIETLSNSQ